MLFLIPAKILTHFFRFIFDRCYDNEQSIMHNEQQPGSHFAGLQHVASLGAMSAVSEGRTSSLMSFSSSLLVCINKSLSIGTLTVRA